ncbi:MAG: BtaA family protein [Verrucomicrobiales bacterium]|nr:BtaA family protein [Verrucomicrobiales bacterium]
MKAVTHWTTRQIFRYIHGHHLVYNTCWEDPRLDREVMSLSADDEIVLITSAGCNALDYALDRPSCIHAVDLNFRQNALLELKLAGIRRLEFEEFFALFGEGGHREFPHWYETRLRPELTDAARQFWDTRTGFLSRPTPQASFYHHGTTGFFARMLVKYLRVAKVHAAALRLFGAASLAEQREIYFSSIRDRLWRPAIKRALRTDIALSLLGVPKAQRDHLERTCATNIADFMEDCVESVFTRLPVADNYFWRLYLFGRYSVDCSPEYLKPANFARLKGGWADRICIHTGDLTGFLQSHTGSLSRFVLLDHMDWLSHQEPELLRREWQAIVDRARPGARILWRSGGAAVDFVDPIEVRRSGRRHRVGELLTYHTDLAAQCHARDRVHTYGSFHVADLAA